MLQQTCASSNDEHEVSKCLGFLSLAIASGVSSLLFEFLTAHHMYLVSYDTTPSYIHTPRILRNGSKLTSRLTPKNPGLTGTSKNPGLIGLSGGSLTQLARGSSKFCFK
eukprot:Blabericola_migrator_1__2702@NODE_176_length_11972_cov_72_986308_g153_i0_p9_GENE_NODE_176_length_11972_cov_72_986308_g153_i0NODE_176_length_11972_cov_72_986308_g153_i0_p9_ORF_typecomplete_len109_score7_07_NODE_176_length_11972_cov_72_986308_g153_i036453971